MVLLTTGLIVPVVAQASESPHWTGDGCETCHMESAPVDGAVNLKAESTEELCEMCHGSRGDASPCRHSSGVSIGDVNISEALQAFTKDGQVVCSTCHDIVYQCERPKAHFSFQNRGFLRDRTSRAAADYCFKCHSSSAFSNLNPHNGVTGNPARPTCLLCHEEFPETDPTGKLSVSFNMKHDLNDTCQGCHNSRPHPRSMSFSREKTDEWIHLVQPSSDVLAKLRVTQAETGIELPLDPQTGEVFCATCHNPHGFKVGGEHGSLVGTEHKLRTHNICQACHDK